MSDHNHIFISTINLDVLMKAHPANVQRLANWLGANTVSEAEKNQKARIYRLACNTLRAIKRGHP